MQYDDLLAELRSALDAGRVEEADVRRVLARADRAHRPGPAGVLRAAGAIVFLLGLGLLFGLGYADYPYAVQLVGPFVFATAVAVVGAMHAAVRLVRLTSWGLSASLVAFTAFAADVAGFLHEDTAAWLVAGSSRSRSPSGCCCFDATETLPPTRFAPPRSWHRWRARSALETPASGPSACGISR